MRWPSERGRREQLRRQRRPRLLLLEDDAAPPHLADCLEDWIRLPAADFDFKARADSLVVRAQCHLGTGPEIDGGVVRVGDGWVSLTPLESRLAEVLLQRMGTVASRDTLVRAGWPEGTQARNTLDVHVVRLRRRLSTVGLALRTVRSRGYLLEMSGSCQQGVHEP